MSEEIAALRTIVAEMPPPAEAMAPYLAKVRERAYAVTDADVEQLKAGLLGGRDLRADRRGRDRAGPPPLRRRHGRDRMIRLSVVDHGHAPDQAAFLQQARERSGREPFGVVKTLVYRPEIFGGPFTGELHRVMRGPSDWSAGERELFAGFTSLLNQCPF